MKKSPKTTVTATRSFTYGTRRLAAGDEFEASEHDARLLVAAGSARASETAKKKRKRNPGYSRRDMQAEAPSE